MRRHLPRLLLTGALLSPASLYALGLGEIHLNSALNQPFDAEIELIAPTREELAELKVSLASNELFQRYGLERPQYLSSFQFAVSRSSDGQVKVKVTSNRSVTEPFVTLLVEASWGRGRLLREYTVLLDPPVFMPSQPQSNAPVTAPQSGARNEGRIERAPTPAPAPQPAQTHPVPAPESVTEAPTPRETTPAAIGGTYNVERNDTLYRIASSVQPGASRRVVNQTMIALFRANPQAFGGNINRLRAGSVLRIPESTDIAAIPTSEAASEVARQTEEWSGAPRGTPETSESRLRLVPPQESPAAAAPTAAKPSTTAPAATATSPSATAPATGDKRLEVTSPGLADVQKNIDKTAPAAQQPEPAAQAQPAPEQTPAAAAPAPATEEPAPAPKPAPAPVKQAPPAPPAPSLMERIGDFWWVPVVAGLLLVIGLILAFLRRRREEADVSIDAFPQMSFEPRSDRAERVTPTVSKGRDRETFLVEGEDDEPLAAFDEDAPAPTAVRRSESPKTRPVAPPVESTPSRVDDTLSSDSAVRFDQQDALAEADFHMAYGLYDQAADLVKIAIEREPQRRDLKLKLLEIYFVWGNRELFLDAARDLHATRDQGTAGEWDKVLIMGKQIAPEDSMFKGEAGSHVDLVDVNLEGGENRVDLDLFAEPDGDQTEALDLEFGSGERKSTSAAPESDLDFLLDEQSGDTEEEPTREMDPLARTQETPTIESPMLDRPMSDRGAQTIREKVDKAAFARNSADQTAELSLDDLGLDVDSLESTGALEETASLEKDPETEGTVASRSLRDDEMTQLAPSLGSFDRTLEAPRVEKFDIESTGTIYIDQVDLSGGDTVEQPRPDVDSTASMRRPQQVNTDLDVDFDHLAGSGPGAAETVRYDRKPEAEVERFQDDVFADRTSEFARIDLDVGDALSNDDHAPTNKQVITTEMELSELEPVTMSEVGTKLDLARAYMDMGDPDGARSILEEVLAEGSANQKQEAQRLLESIR